MKIARFLRGSEPGLGAVVGDELVDLRSADPAIPLDAVALLDPDSEARRRAEEALARGPRIALSEVRLQAPVPRPPKFLAVGLNYADHVAESGMERPQLPMIFNKQSTCVTGPYDEVHMPRASSALDYEGELGFVIGRACRHVPRDRAAEVIGGYTVVDDVSVRDWQLRVPTWTMGKSFDTHGPLGPWLVTADELPNPHSLGVRTWVNDELRQDSNTKQLIFDCFALVEHLSTAFTLEPGDVVATGTPGGVGIAHKPPKLLQVGDVVRIEIEGIGRIQNPVVAEPESTVRIA